MINHIVCSELSDLCCKNCLYHFSVDDDNYCRRNSPDFDKPEPWVSPDGWCGQGLWWCANPDSGEIEWTSLEYATIDLEHSCNGNT